MKLKGTHSLNKYVASLTEWILCEILNTKDFFMNGIKVFEMLTLRPFFVGVKKSALLGLLYSLIARLVQRSDLLKTSGEMFSNVQATS